MISATINPVFTSDGGAVIVTRELNDIHLCVGGADQVLTREEARLIAAELDFAANTEGCL